MAILLNAPYCYFADSNGAPLAGGKVYTYTAGTTTPLASYTDSTGGTPAANPVILDSAGRAEIWLSGSYKILVADSLGNTIHTTDNIGGLSSFANVTVTSSSIPANGIYLPAASNMGIAANSALAFSVVGAASGVNFFQTNNAASGSFPSMGVGSGSAGTNIGAILYSKGNESIYFKTEGASGPNQFVVLDTNGATHYPTATGTIGVGGVLSTNGGDLGLRSTGGNVFINTAALATGATAGFIWITTSAGAPTGAATAPYSLAAALHYDSTNNFLYIRCNGSWRKSTVYA